MGVNKDWLRGQPCSVLYSVSGLKCIGAPKLADKVG